MKRNIFILTTLTLTLLLASCGGDKYEAPTIEGTWKTSIKVLTTNKPEVDAKLNKYLREDIEKISTERTFKADKSMIAQRYEGNSEVGRTNYKYELEDGILSLQKDMSNPGEGEDGIENSEYLLGKDILTTTREVTTKEIEELLVEIGVISPGVLPNDMKGEFRMMEKRNK